jgi:hypothetical protein
MKETELAAILAKELGARVERPAGYDLGRIDILNRDWLIEAKKTTGSTGQKNALGQLLVYSYSLKFKGDLGLALIGDLPRPGVVKFCQDNNISIWHYSPAGWRLIYDFRCQTQKARLERRKSTKQEP